MNKERDFWVMLFADPRAEPPEAAPGEGPPFRIELRLLSIKPFDDEPVLAVFSTEEKALRFGRHSEDQEDEDWRVFAPVRLTQEQIRERIFKGNPYGMCAVDPAAGRAGKVVGVSGLHLV